VIEAWLDTLLRGTYEVSVPTLSVASDEIGELTGSGQISWNADDGIRIQAVTNGGDTLTKLFGRFGTPGHLIAHSTFLAFSGRTQDGWELTTDHMPRNGHRTHANLPDVVWDLSASGISLRHESSLPMGRSLRILMGPLPPQWVRMTETEVRNEVFGHRSARLDWLTTTCSIGRVSARQRSDDWFEVRVLPPEGEPMREASSVCTAVARAFSFVLGRRYVIHGHEEINGTRETRRLDTRSPQTTSNTLLQPLGRPLEFRQNVERLLAPAIDFFLTELGERVVPYLYLCWDTADNSHLTRLAMSSICVEGLLRVAAETMGPRQPQVDPADFAAFQEWLRTAPSGFSQPFLNRLNGLAGMFKNLSANEIFRDWVNRGVLGVTKEDFQAWSETRHPSAHGQLAAAGNQEELQIRVFRHDRVQNLLNKILLQLMGYTGVFTDYAQSGYPPVEFPVFSPQAEAPAEEAPPVSQPAGTAPAQPEELKFTAPPVQVQAGDLPDQFEGWELRYQIHSPYDQALPGWAELVAAALRAQFTGATVTVEAVAGLSASATVMAPTGTPEQQVARVREIARSVEVVVARRAAVGTGDWFRRN
jgi:hypothetical protein